MDSLRNKRSRASERNSGHAKAKSKKVFPLPHPLPSTVLLSPHFSRGPDAKIAWPEFRSLRTGTLATQARTWMIKTGEDWNGLHLGKIEKRRPTFSSNLQYVSLYMYQNVINTAEKSFSVAMWPWFCKWKTLGLSVWHLELRQLIINKIMQIF